MKKIIGLVSVATLVSACGGDPKSSSNMPDTLIPDDFVYSSSSTSSSEPTNPDDIVKQSLPFHETFSATNTRHLFSPSYKALNSNPELSFYHATGGFGENYVPEASTSSWLTANANPKLRLSNGRFTLGQSQQDNTNLTVPGTSNIIPGEFDLSEPYTISFCVNQASGAGNLEIYVDNNTTGGNNSLHGSGNASRIAQQQAGTLVVGERFSVSIPNQIQAKQIGTTSSFLQFRVSSGGNVVFDDLIIETQSKPFTGTVPTCVAEDGIDPEPEVAPAAPNVTAVEGDRQITVSWPHSGVGATYEVFYNTTNSLEGAYDLWENPMSGNSVTIIDLVNGQEYWVFVRATNAVGSSEWSEAKSATPAEPIDPGLDVSRTFKLFSKPADEDLQGSGDPAGLAVDTVVVSDTLNFYNKNGTGLRFRASGAWNYNSSSFVDGATVMVADGEVQAGDLRTYIELPLTPGREVTLTYRLKRTSANIGKVGFLTDTGVVWRSIALSGADTAVFDETFTLPEGHAISSLKLVYSREGASGGGLDLIALRKHYAGETTAELDPLVTDDGSSSSADSSISSSVSSSITSSEASSSSVSSEVSSSSSSSVISSSSVSSSEASSQSPNDGGSSSSQSSITWAPQASENLSFLGASTVVANHSVTANGLSVTATGGNLSTSVFDTYFVSQAVSTGNFRFSARLASVSGDTENLGNSYRFGLLAIAGKDPQDNYASIPAFADVGFYYGNAFTGSRANNKADNSRTRSDITGIGVGSYVAIEIYDDVRDPLKKRIRRLTSTDGETWAEANSTTDVKAVGGDSEWHLGIFAAPGTNNITFEFTDIKIEPL